MLVKSDCLLFISIDFTVCTLIHTLLTKTIYLVRQQCPVYTRQQWLSTHFSLNCLHTPQHKLTVYTCQHKLTEHTFGKDCTCQRKLTFQQRPCVVGENKNPLNEVNSFLCATFVFWSSFLYVHMLTVFCTCSFKRG